MDTFDFSLLNRSCFIFTVPKPFGKYTSAFVGLNTEGLLTHLRGWIFLSFSHGKDRELHSFY